MNSNNNLSENDSWLDELIAWADEHEISNEVLPRDKAKILALTSLSFEYHRSLVLPVSISKLANLTSLNLNTTKLNELPVWVMQMTNLMRIKS
jgi:hypothetical protein